MYLDNDLMTRAAPSKAGGEGAGREVFLQLGLICYTCLQGKTSPLATDTTEILPESN